MRRVDEVGGVTGGFHDQCLSGQTVDGTVISIAAQRKGQAIQSGPFLLCRRFPWNERKKVNHNLPQQNHWKRCSKRRSHDGSTPWIKTCPSLGQRPWSG